MRREDRLDVKRDLIPLLLVSLVAVVMYHQFMLAQPYSGDPLGYRYAVRLLARGEPLEFCDDNNARFGKHFTLPFFNYVNSERCFGYGMYVGLPLLLAAVEWLGGEGASYWIVPAFGGVALIAIWILGWRLGNRVVAWLSLIFLAVHPLVISVVTMPMTDVPAMALGLWSMVCWITVEDSHQEDRQGNVVSFVGGVMLGSAVFIRYAAMAWLLTLAMYMVLKYRTRLFAVGKFFWGGALLIVAVTMMLNLIRFGSVVPDIFSPSSPQTRLSLVNMFYNADGWSGLLVTAIVLFVINPLGVLVCIGSWRRLDSNIRLLIVSVIAGGGFISSITLYSAWKVDVRYHLQALTALLIASTLGLSYLMFSGRRRSIIAGCIAVAMVLFWQPWQAFEDARLRNQNEAKWINEIVAVANTTDQNSIFLANDAAGAFLVYGHRSSMIFDSSSSTAIVREMLASEIPVYWIDNLWLPHRTLDAPLLQNFRLDKIRDQPLTYRLWLK
ncbi:MAG: glycosyltransferase family 39 protein [Chloroflexi bacterium]|nr:glycosyltransferase family 39 protein [Chloroflexota bacterium]